MRALSRRSRVRWAVGAPALICAAVALAVSAILLGQSVGGAPAGESSPASAVPQGIGESYQVCTDKSRYLTSPWTYHALKSGNRSYTVAQYKALAGYGTALPPLPGYLTSEGPKAEVAVIFAPGSAADLQSYNFPESPILYFFEGGAYGEIALQAVNGDEFIGGRAPGYPEPTFNDAGNAGGIAATNDAYGYSGGESTLAAPVPAHATIITISTPIPGYPAYVSFADGATYPIASRSGNSITLATPLTGALAAGSPVWADRQQPIAQLTAPAAQGETTVALRDSSVPLVPGSSVTIGADGYEVNSVSGPPDSPTIQLAAGLDLPVGGNTPVYYGNLAGGVSVEFIDISDDQHSTTGTIDTGADWTVEHNDINDGYSTPGLGVAIYGGEQGTIEYNCLSRMGDYGVNIFGANSVFDYNEIYESNYRPDPGCGCSGGGKWWATLNANIVDNSFVDDGIGGGTVIWLDNGNSGTLIAGNYFYKSYSSAIESETGYNLDITGNVFLDGGWGKGGGGCGSNCDGAVNLNSSGGFNVPGSRYENQVNITGNQFTNDWMGIDIWQAGARSCENSGEGWPNDAAYCSGGFPNDAAGSGGQHYYFSHAGTSSNGGSATLASPAAAGSSTILVSGAEAIDDRIGFGDPVSTKTTDTINVSSLTGSGVIDAATTGFPASGELRVGTSAAWSDGSGSYTGAILSYSGKTARGFSGVSLVRGSGTLTGPILEVQPYEVTAEKCYANDCSVTVSPALTESEPIGAEVSNAGTCQLYATSSALPRGPLAPDGTSYWDGCQWEARHISVTRNSFVFQPSVVAGGVPLTGGAKTTSCTAAHADSCGTNFMAYQISGEAPFGTQIAANALMSSSSFTTCPSWDTSCVTDPLRNLNSLPAPPGAASGNGETAGDNVWADNTYTGPWGWNVYLFGACSPLPNDPSTRKSMPSGSCAAIDFTQWQSVWQQETSSSYDQNS